MNRLSSLAFSRNVLLVLAATCASGGYSQAQAAAALPATSPVLPVLMAVEPATTLAATGAGTSSSLASSPLSTAENGRSAQPLDSAPITYESAGSAELPEAPTAPALHAAVPMDFAAPTQQATPNVAPKLTKYIPAGYTAQPITAHDKTLIGLRDLYSPLNFLAMVASAGYEQVLNGEPNYGTDRGAFGQRLGAAAIRESSQGLLTDSIFSPLFHEDPRYYVQGPNHGFFYRLTYAATRPLITRTDSGHSSVNGALFAGYAASAALSYTYYPSSNKNFHDTAGTFGGSLGGAALGFVVSEFSDDLLIAVHLKKK